jgi:hypothetical protein
MNMKECDKRKFHISNKPLMIYISSNNVRYPVTKTFQLLPLLHLFTDQFYYYLSLYA